MNHYDVCVFGAGPAGSVIAKRLAQFGHSVVLVEKRAFPRPHIGLSLTPGIHHWLHLLGLRETVDQAGFTPALESYVLWESNEPLKKEFAPGKAGYHVDRGRFDGILLESAVTEGVELLQPCQLNQLKEDDAGNWQVALNHNEQSKTIFTRFVVDAAGRTPVLKGNTKAYLPSTLATYAYWSNAGQKPISFIEAGANEWFWGAPVSTDQYLACIFSDPQEVKQFASLEDFYKAKIQRSTLFKSQAFDSQHSQITACAATACVDHQPVSLNSIKVGDAAFSMDPLSSQGVQKAIKSAFQGAIVVNTLLKGQSPEPALAYYQQLIETEVRKNTRWTKQFYNRQKRFENSDFWKVRKDTSIQGPEEVPETQLSLKKEDKLHLNPRASISNVPVVGEHFIEYRQGITLPESDEPLVFLQNTELVPLVKSLEGKTVLEVLKLIQRQMPDAKPMDVLKWLVYERVLVVR